VPAAECAISVYTCGGPSQAKNSRWSCGPPPKVADCLPSIKRSTDVAPVATHLSSIIVGELHATGAAGLDVKAEILGPAAFAVVVVRGAVVEVGAERLDVVVGAAVVLVDWAGTELVEEAVVVVDPPPFLPLLHALKARIATTEMITGAMTLALWRTKGGYGCAPPYPGQRCRAS
jgi:hypothetical protein